MQGGYIVGRKYYLFNEYNIWISKSKLCFGHLESGRKGWWYPSIKIITFCPSFFFFLLNSFPSLEILFFLFWDYQIWLFVN